MYVGKRRDQVIRRRTALESQRESKRTNPEGVDDRLVHERLGDAKVRDPIVARRGGFGRRRAHLADFRDVPRRHELRDGIRRGADQEHLALEILGALRGVDQEQDGAKLSLQRLMSLRYFVVSLWASCRIADCPSPSPNSCPHARCAPSFTAKCRVPGCPAAVCIIREVASIEPRGVDARRVRREIHLAQEAGEPADQRHHRGTNNAPVSHLRLVAKNSSTKKAPMTRQMSSAAVVQ